MQEDGTGCQVGVSDSKCTVSSLAALISRHNILLNQCYVNRWIYAGLMSWLMDGDGAGRHQCTFWPSQPSFLADSCGFKSTFNWRDFCFGAGLCAQHENCTGSLDFTGFSLLSPGKMASLAWLGSCTQGFSVKAANLWALEVLECWLVGVFYSELSLDLNLCIFLLGPGLDVNIPTSKGSKNNFSSELFGKQGRIYQSQVQDGSFLWPSQGQGETG